MSAATNNSTTKRPLLMSVRSRDGIHRGNGQGAVSMHIAAASEGSMGSEKGRAVHADGEDMVGDRDRAAGDLERGVRVDYGIERREKRLPSGGS
jgi:hypothetical protein